MDIPGVLGHYNRCALERNLVRDARSEGYAEARRAFLVGYDCRVPRLRQADHRIGCGRCLGKCPQSVDIPERMRRVDAFVLELRGRPG